MTDDAKTTGAAAGGVGVMIEISPGELIDRITILELKAERLASAAARANVAAELAGLVAARDAALPACESADALSEVLAAVNADLWTVEDDLRACEARGDFGAGFVALARSVYRLNDRRAALKRDLNDLFGARLREEKSHPRY